MKNVTTLNQNGQFRYLYRRGASKVYPALVLYAAPNRKKGIRMGTTAGKKVGCAVVRNRAKRRLREVFRAALPHLKNDYDYCLVARTFTASAPYDRLMREFRQAAETLGVWESHEETAD